MLLPEGSSLPEPKRRRKFAWLRRILACLAVLLVLIVLGTVFAGPSVLSALAPVVASRLPLPGRVDVEDVSLSWRGSMRVGYAAVFDPEGLHVATLSIRTGGGLLGLLDGMIEHDIVVGGWASIEVAADGSTNIERALGLERGAEAEVAIQTEEKAELGSLPFSRVILDGLDASITREGSATIALSGLGGEISAADTNITADLVGAVRLPVARPTEREEISNAPLHGEIDASASLDLRSLSGTTRARVAGLTEQAAATLGRLSGDAAIEQASAIAARGGLTLQVDAALDQGLPSRAVVNVGSQTVTADLEIHQQDGAIILTRPGSVTVDSAAFLSNETLRSLALPQEGVEIAQAGAVRISVERLRLPTVDGGVVLEQLAAEAQVGVGRTLMRVPGPDGQPVSVRLSDFAAQASVDPGQPLAMSARAKAGVDGQPDGTIDLLIDADLASALAALKETAPITPERIGDAVPSATMTLGAVPVIAARPWLAGVEHLGFDVPRIVGPTVSASLAWKDNGRDGADVALEVDSAHTHVSATIEWSAEEITLRTPASLRLARPNALASPWLPEGWAMENGQGLTATVTELRVPMSRLSPLTKQATAIAKVEAAGAKLHLPDSPNVGVRTLTLEVSASEATTLLELSSEPIVNNRPGQLSASLSTAGLATLLDSKRIPTVVGSIDLSAPADIAAPYGFMLADRPLHVWLREAVGPQVVARLQLVEPAEEDVANGVLTVAGQHAELVARDVGVSRARLGVGGASLNATPTEALWEGVSPMLGMEGSKLVQTSAVSVDVGPMTFAFGQESALAEGLAATSVRIAAKDRIRIDGVPLGASEEAEQRQRTSVDLANLSASLNSLGKVLSAGAGLEAQVDLDARAGGSAQLGSVRARARSGTDRVIALDVDLQDLDVPLAASLAGLADGAVQAIVGSLGERARLELSASAKPAPQGPRPWSIVNASATINSSYLTTRTPIVAEFDADSISLAQPASLTWQPDANWVRQTIGAEVRSLEPFAINIDQVRLGNPLQGQTELLDPRAVFVDVGVKGKGAMIAIENRPNIELDTLDARVRRIALSSYSITANAAARGGGTLELNGLLTGLTNERGEVDLANALARGTLKGDDVPVAIADAMSNTDGLLTDSLGPVVDLDAEISEGKLVPGRPPAADLRFSVRGPRADVSGYGRLEDHVISMSESQTILTVREVRPEIAERFSELIPEILLVEKRPEDGPAVIQTEGVKIPTNGDWSKGQGNATIALGTARFQTTSLLASVLRATGQRQQGKVGQRIEPIRISMVDGVVTYQPFKLPLGDLTIESEGTVDLVSNQMNVLVWLPMAALSDEAAGSFNTGLGSLVGRTIPGFGATTTVPWRVSGPLDGPSIRPAPQVLIQRRGDQLLGPLLRPGQTVQDILSIPRKREDPPKQGG